jgi:hypothetical protein
MTETLRVLGQSNPPASTLTPLYTCGVIAAAVSSITVCNQDVVNATFNVSIAVGGAADAPQQYLYYQLQITPSDTFTATLGLTLANSDQVRVFSTSANMSFQIFGSEIS